MPELSDPRLERALLGQVLRRPSLLHTLERTPSAADFSIAVHRSAWQVVADLDAEESPVGFELVAAELRRRQAPKAAEQIERLASEAASEGDTMVAELTTRLLAMSRHRRIVASLERARVAAANADTPEDAEAAIDRALNEASEDDAGPRLMGDVARELVEDERSGDSDEIAARTGLHPLDAMLRGGLRRGHVAVLAARPGMGKSALASAISTRAANHGATALVFSMEMTAKDWVRRAVQELGELAVDDIGEERLTTKVDAVVQALETLPLWVEDQSGMSVEAIHATCRRTKRKHGLDLVVVDYMQLARTTTRTQNREREVAEVSQGLLGIAKSLNVAVLALAQLNRGVESRPNKRPTLADLRDSGQIEQDAHEVFFLYRHSRYAQIDQRFHGCVELSVAKNRSGAPSDEQCPLVLEFNGEQMRWGTAGGDLWTEYLAEVGMGSDDGDRR